MVEPKLVFSPHELEPKTNPDPKLENMQQNENLMSLNLLDIISMEQASDVNYHSYPFAIPASSFFLCRSNGPRILLEAKNVHESDRIRNGISGMMAQWTYYLISGDKRGCASLWEMEDEEGEEKEEEEGEMNDLWNMSRAMNDVTHLLVEKSTLQAQRVEEVAI